MEPVKRILLLIAAAGATTLYAQDDWSKSVQRYPQIAMAEMYSDWGIASHLFANNMYRDNGIGFGGELLFNIQQEKPLWGGIGVHTFAFDRDHLNYSQEIDGIVYNYRDLTVSRVFMLHGLLRFQPVMRTIIQPYAQGGFGYHWFFTNTKVTDRDNENERVDKIKEGRDSALGFALAAGIQWLPSREPDVRVDIRFAYYRNASVEYLRYNPDLIGNYPADSFEAKNSAVDMFGIHIGICGILRADYTE